MKARIYTKTGDQGETSLVGGARVSKSNFRLEAYGTLDELNSVIGLVRAHLPQLSDASLRGSVDAHLQKVQNALFNIGSYLACADDMLRTQLASIGAGLEIGLEADMDQWERELPELREFILPGGTVLASFCHQARTVCRRAEREIVRLGEHGVAVDQPHLIFLNRLSDWLFLLSRRVNFASGVVDVKWSK